MHVVVFGAGSLGSLIGGLLAEVHEVTLVGRPPHVEAVREGGLRIVGRLDRTVHPEAVTTLEATPADLALVTVKAYDTPVAAESLARGDLGTALSLQNGMENEATLAAALDCPVLAGTTTFGARLREPGVVECTGVGSVTLGPRPGDPDDWGTAEVVGRALRKAAFDVRLAADMAPHRWEKLAVNAGINPVTALARVDNGALADGPAGDVASAAAAEVADVARDLGVEVGDAREAVADVAASTAANRSSMYQDVLAGRRTEIDAISGYAVEAAREPLPVNEALSGLVRAWETERGLR